MVILESHSATFATESENEKAREREKERRKKGRPVVSMLDKACLPCNV